MSGTAFPSKVTQVDTVARFPLGYEVILPATKSASGGVNNDAGEECWVYVENDATAAAAWAAGHVIGRLGGSVTYQGILAPVDSNPIRVMGVAQHAIASGSFGFIQKKGVAEVLAGTETIDIDEVIAVSATDAGTAMEGGSIAAAAHEASVFGWATESVAAAALATCWINCQG